MEKPPNEEKEFTDNAQTIRPGRSPANGPTPLPVAQAPAAGINSIAEDFDDLDFDDDGLEEKVADFKVNPTSPNPSRTFLISLNPLSSSRHRQNEVSSTPTTSKP